MSGGASNARTVTNLNKSISCGEPWMEARSLDHWSSHKLLKLFEAVSVGGQAMGNWSQTKRKSLLILCFVEGLIN